MNNLFNNISNINKEKILKIVEASVLTFKKDTNIYSNIKDNNTLIYIEYGSIQIIKNDYNGNSTIISNLSTHNIFGSIILPIFNQEYDIITKEETKVTIIDYRNCLKHEDIHYSFYQQFINNLLKIVTTEIEEKNNRIQILTQKTIRDKLLEYFKIVSKKSGSKIIYLSYTFVELSNYLSIDRSAMSRELKFLKEEGFIKIDYRKITLLY